MSWQHQSIPIQLERDILGESRAVGTEMWKVGTWILRTDGHTTVLESFTSLAK